MSPTDLVSDWRREIAAELQKNAAMLADATAALEAAEAAHAEALSEWNALQQFITQGLHKSEGLGGPVNSRLQLARTECDECAGRRGAARALVKSLTDTGESLRGALDQCARIMAADRVVEFPTTSAPARRRPPIVPFDTIEEAAR
jgi:hypothetical protein